ncbi:MAG: NAD(P)-binding domain-containing protein [Spirochaetes bacterium]|nr:NAD(P)-binding domain-containing protein [Spirochaetota bacterium]
MTADFVKILITAPFHEQTLDKMKNNYQVDYFPELAKSEIEKIIHDYHIFVISTIPEIDQNLLKKARNLQLIIRMGIGVDHIDLDYCLKKHIKVHITPRANILPVVELVMSQLIHIMRRLQPAEEHLRAGQFRKALTPGSVLSGKTIGVIGAGRIGSRICQVARFFEMNVLACDPYLSQTKKNHIPAHQWVDVNTIIQQADIVTFHVPLTSETHHMVDEVLLGNLKKGGVLINTARGKIIDLKAVEAFMQKRQDIHFIFDVYENEPEIPEFMLNQQENFTLTPHIGAYSIESKQKRSEECLEQIHAYFSGKKVHGRIDLKRGY